ncbi:MAG TPA: hypothetical protein PKE30_02030 [Niabella sp.]|nr:hypothetical protein [Niabella sp.]
MRKIKNILPVIIALFSMCYSVHAQQKEPSKINDIFFQYVVQILKLKPEEADQMRPLVKEYLYKRRKIATAYSDPLEREQKTLDLKINSRKQMAGIIGMQRANSFFASEQNFRRKVRDEIRQRNNEKKFN